MGRRRGFFAELQHQAAVAERNRQRAQAAAIREAQRQLREAERALAAAERARIAAGRASTRAKSEAEREAKRLHIAAQEAEVESRNAQLQANLADIDDVLAFTLGVDDYVNLEELRQVAEHPPFTSPHERAIPAPAPITVPPEPAISEIPPPTGLTGVFKRKAHAAEMDKRRTWFEQAHAEWGEKAAAIPMRQLEQLSLHSAAEAERLQKLEADRGAYDARCQRREAEAADANARLDALIRGHEAGDKAAVEEYFNIVFGNSVYPDGVSVDFEQSYKPAEKELEVALSLPKPGDVPTARSYRYVKARDEIVETSQSAKEQRDRYNALVHAIVLRTLHEVWESDRRGYVDTISLIAAVEHTDPAIGRPAATPIVAVAARRDDFQSLDLAHVTPTETLKHLTAVVSPNPHDVRPIDVSAGLRG